MRKWLVGTAVCVVFAIAGIGMIKRTPSRTAFEALPVGQQNLALYDAFWAAIDANYYEPRRLETPQIRELRARWRAKAETANAITIYWNVLQPLTEQFPHSHIEVKPGFENEDVLAALAKPGASERTLRAVQAMSSGAGFEAATIRRGAGTQKVVGEVLTGSVAARAGITPGWRIVSAVNSFTPSDEKAVFIGEFMPGGAGAETRKITFDLEPLPKREHFLTRRLASEVTYIRFDLFGEAGEPDKVIAAIESAGPSGLVLDLRSNVGGLSDELLRIAGHVLGDDVSVGLMRGRAGSADQRTKAEQYYAGPLAVLIGPVSASAAEILAAAVQDRARGKLIGRATNGSVLCAKYVPLPDGGAVMVPTHDILRIDGRHIEAAGVEPDVEIVPTLEDVRAGRDPALARALLELGNVQVQISN